MRGIGGSTLRGGQTVFHAIRMWGQLFRAAMLFAAFTTVAVPAWTLWHRTTGAEWYAAGMVTLAEGQARAGLRPGLGPGNQVRRRHPAHAPHPRYRRLRPGQVRAGAHQGGDVRERGARGHGRRGADRAVPGRVLVPGRAARAPEAHQGRRNGHGLRAAPAGAIPQCAAAGAPSRRQTPPPLQHRGRPVSREDRDAAHHRLGHYGVRQDGADLRPGGADPRTGRTLRHLRQDGELHGGFLRGGPRRAAEPARPRGRRAGRRSTRRTIRATST